MTVFGLVAAYAEAVGCSALEAHGPKRRNRYFNEGRTRVVRLDWIIYRKPPEVIVFDSARGYVKVSYRDFLKSKGAPSCA